MFPKAVHLFLPFLFFHFLNAEASPAESLIRSEPDITISDTLRVGLVLSGGGAKGVAHIGVIKAIEEAGVRIDYITGTSMGSLVGALYAIGYNSDQLYELARENNFVELFTENADRRHISNYEKGFDDRTVVSFPISERGINLPAGIITGQNIYTYLSGLAWMAHSTEDFNELPIPFAAVATDLETGEAVVFRSGYLPDAIRASISIPSAFIPHEINGKYFIDGGLARNLPVQDAIDMGANYIIAVDVSTPLVPKDSLRSLTEIMNQAVMYRVIERSEREKLKADLAINVSELNEYAITDFNLMEEFLDIGLREGRKHMDQFKQVADRQNIKPPVRPGIPPPVPLPISNVIIEGNSLFDDEFIIRKLEFEPGIKMTPNDIENRISKLYSSSYIEQVTYRIKPDTLYQYNLHIKIQENKRNNFNVGLRYETDTQASILLESTFQDLMHPGSINRFEARLGDKIQFGTEYVYYGALGSSLAALTSVWYHSERVEWYNDFDRVSSFTHRSLIAEISAGNYFSTQNLFTLGIKKEFSFHLNEINSEDTEPVDEGHHGIVARYRFDRHNRKAFPTSGQKFVSEGYHSNPVFQSPLLFTSVTGLWEGYIPLTERLSFRHVIYAGYTYGTDIPWNYWHTVNRFSPTFGFVRVGGFDRFQVTNRNIQLASIGLQIEPMYHRFIGAEIYAGRFLPSWDINVKGNDIEYGASFTVGALTILGPVKAIFSSSTLNSFKAELQIGYQF
jgi:NTE family protein